MQKTFASAMLHVGMRMPDESVGAFAQQLKKLTDADRKWFIDRFAIEHGIIITA